MVASTNQLSRDPAYERFLAAPVGNDQNGTSVSVLSMFARLDVDPWIEASDLASMQKAPARQRLEAVLARFDDVPTLASDQSRVASGLLDFLPKRSKSAEPSPQGSIIRPVKLPLGAPIYWIVSAILFLGWIATLAQGN